MIKYVFNMPYQMIWDDIRQYVELRKKYKEINGKCEQLYKELSAGIDVGCVIFFEEKDKSWFKDGKRVNYCDKFFYKNCTVNECPSVKKHNLYWSLMEERKNLMTAKAEFWGAKFQNVR